jgi:ABC-type phosphate transport system auxiliary subunit
MNKIEEILEKYYNVIIVGLLIILLFKTCGSDIKSIIKRIDKLTEQVDSLKSTSVTKKDLMIEGLKTEKRMIQSTDRKILDVNRQAAIDADLKKLEGESEK